MSDAYSILPPLGDIGKQGEASPSVPPGYYQQLVSMLESARNAMGGDPTLMGSLGLMMNAIPAGRMAAPTGGAAPRFGPGDLQPPPALQPLDIKGMNLPAASVRPGFDPAAFQQADALRQQMGVSARTPGGQSTDAALKAIQEALALVPRQFR